MKRQKSKHYICIYILLTKKKPTFQNIVSKLMVKWSSEPTISYYTIIFILYDILHKYDTIYLYLYDSLHKYDTI